MSVQAAVAQPDLALLLLLAGVFLVYAEFNRPGTVVLGCAGALCVMLGVFGLSQRALSTPALAACGAGVVLILAGLRVGVRGGRTLLAFLGALALAGGLARLAPGVHAATAILAASLFTGVTVWLGRVALQARRNKFAPGSMPWDTPPGKPTR